MKKIVLITMLAFIANATFAQDIELSYANAQITNDGTDDFYEVDVFVKANDPFKYGRGQFYITYNTDAFGLSPAADGNFFFEQPEGSLLDIGIDATPFAKFFSGFNFTDNDEGIISVNWAHTFAASTISDNTVTATPRLLCHVRFRYIDVLMEPNICFDIGLTTGQNAEACGPFTDTGNPFEGANCTTFPAVVRTNDTYDCQGAQLPVELCTGGSTTWNTGTGWSDGTPDNTMTAIINGLYSTANNGNLDACELTITTTGSVTVDALGYIQIENDIINEGNLNVAHTANVVQVNDDAVVTNLGNIKVFITTADVDTRDFVMLGSPMDGETREDVWAAAYNVQTFVPELFVPFGPQEMGVVYNFQSQDYTVWDPMSGLLEPSVGYLVFPQNAVNGPGGTFDYEFNTGTLNNGVYTQTLQFNGSPETSPNMLSNPYASAIDADVFFTENPLVDTVYFWEHGAAPSEDVPGPEARNFSMRDVSAYNSTGGIMAASGAGTIPNGVIASAQGFGVFAPSATDVVFNNSMRLTSGNTTLRTTEVQKDRLWLHIEDLTFGEGANMLVGFVNGATEGYEAKYDSPVIDNVVSLHSYIEDDFTTGYSIQGREPFTENATVKLGFNTHIDLANTYRISLSNMDGTAWENNEVYLTDNSTGEITNLSKTSYTFAATTGHYENRFLLSFKDKNVLATEAFDVNTISLYPNPAVNSILINAPQTNIESITIFDINGRMIVDKKDLNVTTTQIDVATLQTGVYIATIITESGKTNKQFIKN